MGTGCSCSCWSGSHELQSGSRWFISLNLSLLTALSSTATSELPNMEPIHMYDCNACTCTCTCTYTGIYMYTTSCIIIMCRAATCTCTDEARNSTVCSCIHVHRYHMISVMHHIHVSTACGRRHTFYKSTIALNNTHLPPTLQCWGERVAGGT